MNKPWIIFIGLGLFIILFAIQSFVNYKFLSDAILTITAIIVLWYTWETYHIRKSNQEILHKSQRPIIGYSVFLNEQNPIEIRFQIINHSDYPVAARINCNFKINNKPVKDAWPAYTGKEFWNLQYKEIKVGHFHWIELCTKEGIFEQNEVEKIKRLAKEDMIKTIFTELIMKYNFDKPPEFSMEIEVFCMNEFGQFVYYPPVYYELDYKRIVLIPRITSTQPFWEYDKKPSWVT